MTRLLDASGLAKRFGGLGEKSADAEPRAVQNHPEVVRVHLGEDGC